MGGRGPGGRRGRAVVVVGLVAVSLVSQLPGAGAAGLPGVPSASSVVVELRDGVSADAVARTAEVDPTTTYEHALDGFAGSFTGPEIARLRRDPRVRSIVPNRRINVLRADQPAAPISGLDLDALIGSVVAQVEVLLVDLGVVAGQAIPNAVRRVGGAASPTARIDGVDRRLDATIAVIDTGIARHRDLNIVGGRDCVGNDPFADENGHGTAVAGTAAAIDNKLDVVGVAPGARLLAARAADARGGASLGSLLCALEWAIDPAQGTDVINMSLAWPLGSFDAAATPCGSNDLVHDAICRAVERGITVVAAAGNNSASVAGWFPAAYPEVVAVAGFADFDGRSGGLAAPTACGAADSDDTFWSSSNFGAEVDVAAVAVCVVTTASAGGTTVGAGTSFASPAVAGAAALIYASSPQGITPERVRARLLSDAEAGPIPGDPDGGGEGVLDVSDL